jgi:hypothetical protein
LKSKLSRISCALLCWLLPVGYPQGPKELSNFD